MKYRAVYPKKVQTISNTDLIPASADVNAIAKFDFVYVYYSYLLCVYPP
jgi:hypothetical protein